MTAFNYTAIDKSGKTSKGLLEGDSPRQVRQLLRDRGLSPLEVTAVNERIKKTKGSKAGAIKHSNRYRMASAELALVTRQLATLLSAAMPLEECLDAVSDQTEKK